MCGFCNNRGNWNNNSCGCNNNNNWNNRLRRAYCEGYEAGYREGYERGFRDGREYDGDDCGQGCNCNCN